MVAAQLPLLLTGAVALLALLFGFKQLTNNRKLGRELSQLKERLVKVEAHQEQKPSFSSRLDLVEKEQKIVESPRSSSEKYRYVSSLAGQGVDAKGIASALQMAPAEVEQLLQLVRLKQKVPS